MKRRQKWFCWLGLDTPHPPEGMKPWMAAEKTAVLYNICIYHKLERLSYWEIHNIIKDFLLLLTLTVSQQLCIFGLESFYNITTALEQCCYLAVGSATTR